MCHRSPRVNTGEIIVSELGFSDWELNPYINQLIIKTLTPTVNAIHTLQLSTGYIPYTILLTDISDI